MLHQLRCSTQDVVAHSFLELKVRCALGNWRSPTGIMVSGELFTIQFNPKGPVINCEQNPNAETDAAINLEHECKKARRRRGYDVGTVMYFSDCWGRIR